ncbi:methyltransferase domain protein, partial [Cooperia oncophora]
LASCLVWCKIAIRARACEPVPFASRCLFTISSRAVLLLYIQAVLIKMSKADLEQRAFAKIPEYMLEQNRPYSAVDVFTNLRQEFGKTLVLKVLESSVSSGVLKDKVIGKQKIFYANQDKLEKYDEAAIAECDSKINSLSEKVKSLAANNKEIQNELRDLSNVETTSELRTITTELKKNIEKMKARIAKLETSRDPSTAEDGKRALQMEQAISKAVQKRKRLATDMLNAIMESSPLPKRELLVAASFFFYCDLPLFSSDSHPLELQIPLQMDTEGGFHSVSSSTYRELSEEEKEKLQEQDVVSAFKQRKLEAEAQKNWDKFYHRNRENFFKDRNWSSQDLQEICHDMDLKGPIVFLEAGCGVGNMLFPLKTAFPNFHLQAFDFSPRAVQMCSERAKQLGIELETSIVDLSIPSDKSDFEKHADIATLIFVLSAIHPDKHGDAVRNMRKYVRTGGSVVVRDYGVNDYAMIRFGRGAKLADRFYVRQDGTRAYYFYIEELERLFEADGWKCVLKEYLHRQTINHQKQLNVPRIFVQARFVKL